MERASVAWHRATGATVLLGLLQLAVVTLKIAAIGEVHDACAGSDAEVSVIC